MELRIEVGPECLVTAALPSDPHVGDEEPDQSVEIACVDGEHVPGASWRTSSWATSRSSAPERLVRSAVRYTLASTSEWRNRQTR